MRAANFSGGKILKEEYSPSFDGKEMLNCHPGNVQMVAYGGFGIDAEPIVFELQASHAVGIAPAAA